MKKYKRKISGVASIILLTVTSLSCSKFFITPIRTETDLETVFSSMYNANRALYAAYPLVPYNWPYKFQVSLSDYQNAPKIHMDITASICDEAVSSGGWTGATRAYYGYGTITPLTVGIDAGQQNLKNMEFIFEEPYFYFRRAFLVLENIDKVPDATPEWKSRTVGETKLLIALGYYELTKRFGGVPWVDRVLDASSASEERLPLKEQINRIDALILDAINSDLPDRGYESDEMYGRVSKATAYFLRSRLWLLAASPLFNTNVPYMSYEHPELVCMMNDEAAQMETWRKAVEYTKQAIDFMESHGYELMQPNSTRDAVQTYTEATRNLPNNTEVIQFSRRTGLVAGGQTANNLYGRHMPPRQGSKAQAQSSYTQITQNLVDMYKTVDGSEVNYNTSNPWEKLDPRFHATVVHDQDVFADCVISTSKGDNVPQGGEDIYRTGYFMKKFFWEDQYLDGGLKKDMVYFYMRLPELYLNYAEALNEYSPGDPGIAEYLRKVTSRVGMPDCDVSGDQEAVRQEIRRERAVELALEDQRYFDCLRWKIADKTIGGTKYAIQRVGAPTDPNRTYERVEASDLVQTIWSDMRYLQPFPQTEINKHRGLVQNPGY